LWLIVYSRKDAKVFSSAPGVTSQILITGERMMMLLIDLEPGSAVPPHSHPHEQIGICLKGRVEFTGEDKTVVVEPDMVYFMRSNEKHGAKVVSKEGATILEVFSPPREDFLARVK